MKKSVLVLAFAVLLLFPIINISAEGCNLDISMINQDPYPAIPGDYVKIVFQVDGIADPDCGEITFELLDKYPISLDEGESPEIVFQSGVYKKDYSSFLTAPYKVRIDKDAVDGDNPIEVQYKRSSSDLYITKQFMLNIEDSRADFEIHVKDYDYMTNTITFEILNIGEKDVEALTVEIPKQDNIIIKGSNRNIVGDIDSSEFTTADFEAIPSDGNIKLNVLYTDSIDVRRTLEIIVPFESSYFQNRISDQKVTPTSSYIIAGIIVFLVIYFIYRRMKKKKENSHKK